jgi:hypothetical protein
MAYFGKTLICDKPYLKFTGLLRKKIRLHFSPPVQVSSLKVVVSELIPVFVLYEMKSTNDLSHITVVGNMLSISMTTTESSL